MIIRDAETHLRYILHNLEAAYLHKRNTLLYCFQTEFIVTKDD